MSGHADQHIVPQFLLKHWHRGADERLSAFRWADGKLRSSRFKAKSVAKARHIYSMQRSKAAPDVRAERDFLGPKVDDPAAVVHKEILETGVRSLNDEDKQTWSAFLVSLMLRGQSMMLHMRARGRAILGAGLDETPDEYQAVRGDDPAPTLRTWIEKHHPDQLEDLAVQALPELVFSQKLNLPLLNGCTSATRRLSTAPHDLLMSDSPLIYVGTLDKGFIVALPIAPQMAFFAVKPRETWDNIAKLTDRAIVRELNLHICQTTDQYVYSTGIAQELFIKKHLPHRHRRSHARTRADTPGHGQAGRQTACGEPGPGAGAVNGQ